ncbi:related to Sedlin (trafficking protein particle complex protein 2) [Melanopsichium pennsylvanicum]|uniref:Related to Sedlin (Trafficking protein particle complex protein 2) n=1 Tax=Melanopsichium pennsylvanicum TaxID=63383 RepID=A0AAJ4XPM3_9BASI|nr:related to Sedlin (trafficking protein particle complex protein 2) [Melanopsichium pennsylvanicum]
MSYYLTLIGTRDNPLYETEITPKTASSSAFSSSSSTISGTSALFAGTSSNSASDAGTSGASGIFGGLLSRMPTTTSALTTSTGSNITAGVTGSGSSGSGAQVGKVLRKQRYELQMIAHSALDTIEDAMVSSPYLYLKSIDRIQEYTTSCFLLPGSDPIENAAFDARVRAAAKKFL